MQILTKITIGFIIFGILIYIYKKKYSNPLETILIGYSEQIGDRLVVHPTNYIGFLNYNKDIMTIPKLNLKRPIPSTDVMIPTKNGGKKVNIINFGLDRYGYRVCSLNNQTIIEKRDEEGKIIKKHNKPILIKHKWRFCDNVIEPDVKHWETHMKKEIEERHKNRDLAFTKWMYPIGMAMLFAMALISLNIITKQLTTDKSMIMEQATQAQADAKRTTDNLNNIMEKLTGKKVIPTNQPNQPEKQNEIP